MENGQTVDQGWLDCGGWFDGGQCMARSHSLFWHRAWFDWIIELGLAVYRAWLDQGGWSDSGPCMARSWSLV